MQLGISRRSTITAALLIALAALVYLSVPQVRNAVDTVAAILMTSDVQAAIEAFRDYLLGFGPWAAVVSITLMIVTCQWTVRIIKSTMMHTFA